MTSTVYQHRRRRHRRIRKKISGTPDRPRLAVFRSNRNLYVQLIDDVNGRTLASASTLDAGLKSETNSVASAATLGEAIAERALEQGLDKVVFDRGGYRFHGKVKALADHAREKGLKF